MSDLTPQKAPMSSVVKIYALFLGSALLMFGGGLQGLLLSVRGAEEDFSLLALGLIGTGWSVGFVAGSITVPLLVQRVGHIRAFSIMAAIGTDHDPLQPAAGQRYRAGSCCGRFSRLLLCRRGDDRRELAQRGRREQEPRHDLFDLRHHQHGGLDAGPAGDVGDRRARATSRSSSAPSASSARCCRRALTSTPAAAAAGVGQARCPAALQDLAAGGDRGASRSAWPTARSARWRRSMATTRGSIAAGIAYLFAVTAMLGAIAQVPVGPAQRHRSTGAW